MMNKGQIHRDLKKFQGVFKVWLSLMTKMSWDIRDFNVFRKKTSTQMHIIKNSSIFYVYSRRNQWVK